LETFLGLEKQGAKIQKKEDKCLLSLVKTSKGSEIIFCPDFRQKPLISFCLLHDGQPARGGRLPWTFSHGNRVCFCVLCLKVGMFFSSLLMFIFTSF